MPPTGKRDVPAWRRALKKPSAGRATLRIVVRLSDGGTIVVDLEDVERSKSLELFQILGVSKTVELVE